MYYCESCKSFVDGKTYEVGPESIDPPETVCEVCGSDDLEDSEDCPYCEEQKRTEQDMCDDCQEKFDRIVSNAIAEIENELCIDYKEAVYLLERKEY